MAEILIVDDDPGFAGLLSRVTGNLGHGSTVVGTLKDAFAEAMSHDFDVILLDVDLPDGNGVLAIPKLQKGLLPPEIIIITGVVDPGGAELAIKSGAWDYFSKDCSTKEISLILMRVLGYREEKKANLTPISLDRRGIIGNSFQMKECLDMVALAAHSDTNVLITGETGTGKELLAGAVHRNSPQAQEPFVVVDCAALPESLVEGILFGHKKGSFTGAERNQPGLIKQAEKGTLFLDEVGELPLTIQKKFLRILQERRYRPVGGKREEEGRFRLIAATNRDLEKSVEAGEFRADLFHRLCSIRIESPPLRKRVEDIKDLVMYNMTNVCEISCKTTKSFSSDFFDVLKKYNWPGNVRELFNTINSMLATVTNSSVIHPHHLPVPIRAEIARLSFLLKNEHESSPHKIDAKEAINEEFLALEACPVFKDYRAQLLETGEKKYFKRVVGYAKGDIIEVCRLAGLSKSRVYFFLQKHSISLSADTPY